MAEEPTPPRRVRMSRDARREQVLGIAQELFSSLGYHHVSMDDIADRAEVTKPVLYRHFPSKLDLYLAVIDRGGEDLLTAVRRALDPIVSGPVRPGDGRAVVHAIMKAYFSYVETAGQASTLLFESDVTRDADVRTRVEHAPSETARVIAGVLSDFTGLSDEHNRLLATALVGMAQVAATAHRRYGEADADAGTAAALVADLAWGGVTGLIRPDYPYAEVAGTAAPDGH